MTSSFIRVEEFTQNLIWDYNCNAKTYGTKIYKKFIFSSKWHHLGLIRMGFVVCVYEGIDLCVYERIFGWVSLSNSPAPVSLRSTVVVTAAASQRAGCVTGTQTALMSLMSRTAVSLFRISSYFCSYLAWCFTFTYYYYLSTPFLYN